MITIDDVTYTEDDLSEISQIHVARINQLRKENSELQMMVEEKNVLISAYANAIVNLYNKLKKRKLKMADNSVTIPTWALPLIVSLFVGAISYGAAQANAQTTTKEVKRIEVIVKETAKKAQANGQAQAVTETKVDAIVESLARQEKIQEKTNDQIAALVQALLAKQ